MASNPQRQLPGATVTCHTKAPHSSLVNYLVTQEVLSVQFNPPFHPRLVLIPVKAIVQIMRTSSDDGFVEIHWENRIHKIFEADMTRLTVYRNGVNRGAHLDPATNKLEQITVPIPTVQEE